MPGSRKTFFLIDGSHYDRLRSVLATSLNLRKIAIIASKGVAIDNAVYFRDLRDNQEAERQRPLLGWLKHNGFDIKSTTHSQREQRERYGTNLVEMAVYGLLAADCGDHVIVMAGDSKLAPLFIAYRLRGIDVTLISTLSAPAKIAPASNLLENANDFLDLAEVLSEIAIGQQVSSVFKKIPVSVSTGRTS